VRRFSSDEIRAFVSNPRFTRRDAEAGNSASPRISVVVPSFNQAAYLERTLLSVLNQDYPDVELIVVDGGSTDGSREILRRYDAYIAHWVSEPDGGQAAAVNKGIRAATGEIIGWQNSDDIYLPGAFRRAAEEFRRDEGIDVCFGNVYIIDVEDSIVREMRYTPFSLRYLMYRGWNLTNQAAFFRAGTLKEYLLDESWHYAMDADLFLRLGRDGRLFRFIREFLGCLRQHSETKSCRMGQAEKLREWIALRQSFGIPMDGDVEWDRQYRVIKLWCDLTKLFRLLIQRDFDFILFKLREIMFNSRPLPGRRDSGT
jgi:glycosyltransferase involved in cell wall biosynthesis